MYSNKKIAALFSIVLGISACATAPVPYTNSLKEHQALVRTIRTHDVQVVETGEKVLMVVPIDDFFIPQSTELNMHYKKLFYVIAGLIRSYPNAMVQVNGYSDDLNVSPAARKKLSLEYAQVITSYLWNAGITEDRITTQGFGSENKVADNRLHGGDNRRVEIIIHS